MFALLLIVVHVMLQAYSNIYKKQFIATPKGLHMELHRSTIIIVLVSFPIWGL